MTSYSLSSYIHYGFLNFALAFLGLPLYLYIPQYYSAELGLSLSLIGTFIVLSRLIDIIQDPFIGYFSDRLVARGQKRAFLITLAALLLIPSFYLLLNPFEGISVAWWFFITLTFCYSSYSIITINYFQLSAELTQDYTQQSYFTSAREGLGVAGITIASLVPSFVGKESHQTFDMWFVIFVICCGIGLMFLFHKSLKPKTVIKHQRLKEGWQALKNHPLVLWLSSIYFINIISAGIPAVLILFYIEHVIQRTDQTGYFLGAYFLSAVICMPIWGILTRLASKKHIWLTSMTLTTALFVWAAFLGPGDILPYYAICVLTGACLGADLSIPPSLLADLLVNVDEKGIFFGRLTHAHGMRRKY